MTAPLTHFLIEPFVPHSNEYYISILAERECTRVVFSTSGGIHVEENWDSAKEIEVEVGDNIDKVDLGLFQKLLEGSGERDTNIPVVLEFIRTLFRLFEYLDFAMLEINPFVLNAAGQPVPLDLVAEVDDTAFFKNQVRPLERHAHFSNLINFSTHHRRSNGAISLSLCPLAASSLRRSSLSRILTERRGRHSSSPS